MEKKENIVKKRSLYLLTMSIGIIFNLLLCYMFYMFKQKRSKNNPDAYQLPVYVFEFFSYIIVFFQAHRLGKSFMREKDSNETNTEEEISIFFHVLTNNVYIFDNKLSNDLKMSLRQQKIILKKNILKALDAIIPFIIFMEILFFWYFIPAFELFISFKPVFLPLSIITLLVWYFVKIRLYYAICAKQSLDEEDEMKNQPKKGSQVN